PAAVPAGPRFGVHLTSQTTEAGARQDAARFQRAGYPTVIRHVEIPKKGWWWRVYVGPYGDRAEAAGVAAELKRKNITDYTQIHRLPAEDAE
ncbi:MAG: SPOR domain-containing protein, partial [Gemmatimonadetes bacterium]|nr:SPOR domain-containing protein [Gemmatimonadota bacterium]